MTRIIRIDCPHCGRLYSSLIAVVSNFTGIAAPSKPTTCPECNSEVSKHCEVDKKLNPISPQVAN